MHSGIIKNMNQTILIIIISLSSLVAVALLVVLYIFVFSRRSIKRQIRLLDRKFEYLHGLLIGQDAQYVARLEIISRRNLLYTEQHANFLRRFKEIRDKSDSVAQKSINELKRLVDNGEYKGIKQSFIKTKELIAIFDKEVQTFNKDLQDIIKPEENARQASLEVKESLRLVKQVFIEKQSEIQLLAISFEEVFTKIEVMFADHDSLVESAKYDEAVELIPNIKSVVSELKSVMNEAPTLCLYCDEMVPSKIITLENKFKEMNDLKIPLNHLITYNVIEDLRKYLTSIKEDIKQFKVKNAESKLLQIVKVIDTYLDGFEKEKNDKNRFEAECNEVYHKTSEIEREFIKLCNSVPSIEKIYIISFEKKELLKQIQTYVDNASRLKRSLDTFIHSSTKQAFSFLASKMDLLKEETTRIEIAMNDFMKYRNSLKADSNKAYEFSRDFYFKVQRAEIQLDTISIEEYAKIHRYSIDDIYELLSKIHDSLVRLPIDVELVNTYVEKLSTSGAVVINTIESDLNYMSLAETAMVFGNRERGQFNDTHMTLTQCEKLFFSGEFKKCYDQSGVLLQNSRMHNTRK